MYYTKDPIIYFFKGISPSRYSLYGTLIKYLLEKCSVSHNIYLLWSKCLGPIFIWYICGNVKKVCTLFSLPFKLCRNVKKLLRYGCFFFAKKVRILFVKKQANNLCKSVSPSMVARVSSSLLLWCKCDLKWE